jgi:hypothetical protein
MKYLWKKNELQNLKVLISKFQSFHSWCNIHWELHNNYREHNPLEMILVVMKYVWMNMIITCPNSYELKKKNMNNIKKNVFCKGLARVL